MHLLKRYGKVYINRNNTQVYTEKSHDADAH